MGTKALGSAGVLLSSAALCAVLAQGCGGQSATDSPSSSAGGGGSAQAGGQAGSSNTGGSAGGAGQGGDWGEWGPAPAEPPSAVDLLFVIDNSLSMSDKQALLKEAVPQLVRRLVSPNCVSETGEALGTVDALGQCSQGSPEFAAVTDLHLGVITSSLGGHGGQVCVEAQGNPMLDDKAHLLGTVREGLSSWNGAGFLAWDPKGTANTPAGESDAETLVATFQNHVVAASEQGCGYESTLEAWYRFLIDPEPSEEVVADATLGQSTKVGTDATVLAQREAFLRPNSLVGIIMLTDENDCSIIDEGQGWLVGLVQAGGTRFNMPRSTSACATDPNSKCCQSCASAKDVAGCEPVANDPECAKGAYTIADDELNLRCFDQKRRFGFDLLQPIKRYVTGLSSRTVRNRSGDLVPNPLFAARAGEPERHISRVFLAGAVGVPWQDIADEESWSGTGLRLLTAAELRAENRWDVILGDPATGVPPSDPLMIEAIDPRTGTHPLLDIAVASPDSTDPQANPINGHEHAVIRRDDLQYACIFPLAEPRDCSSGLVIPCQCMPEDLERKLPLCQPPEGGAAGTTQYYAKAYPGTRHLQLLKELGERSIVASVCPKISAGSVTAPAYGYNPMTASLLDYAAPILRARP